MRIVSLAGAAADTEPSIAKSAKTDDGLANTRNARQREKSCSRIPTWNALRVVVTVAWSPANIPASWQSSPSGHDQGF
jgi:hypothetical protein